MSGRVRSSGAQRLALNLSHNQLTGEVPAWLADAAERESVDVAVRGRDLGLRGPAAGNI